MVEARRPPGSAGVTLLTLRGKPARHMIRLLGRFEVLPMAGVALRRRAGELTADVALGAVQASVSAGQRKPRGGVIEVLEIAKPPMSRRMALQAVSIESCRDVIGVVGCLKLGQMTIHALRGCSDESQTALWLQCVALLAVEREMSAGQGEAGHPMGTHVVAAINEVCRRMALCAVDTELSTMDVAMTGHAVVRDLPELEREVT